MFTQETRDAYDYKHSGFADEKVCKAVGKKLRESGCIAKVRNDRDLWRIAMYAHGAWNVKPSYDADFAPADSSEAAWTLEIETHKK